MILRLRIDFSLNCDTKNFGFEGKNLIAEIDIYTRRFSVFEINSFRIINKLLDSFSNNKNEDIWKTLSTNQKKAISSWVRKKLSEKEVQKIIEIAADKVKETNVFALPPSNITLVYYDDELDLE